MQELRRTMNRGRPRGSGLDLTIHFGIFALMLAVTMPRLVRSFCPAWDVLDTSWAWLLGYAQQHHLQWGTDLVFTYGPLGFLTHSYFYSDHSLWGVSATARLLSWFALGIGFAAIVRQLAPDDRPKSRTTVPVALAWIIGASFLHLSTQATVIGVLLLMLALDTERRRKCATALVLGGALLALGALIKSTGLIVSLFALALYPALWRYARGRRCMSYLCVLPILSFLITFCALWLLASQSLPHLGVYLRGTWAIASGYTPAMSIPALRSQILSALIILALLAAVLAGLFFRGEKIRVAQCLLLGGLAFWAWKEGFTRPEAGYFRHPLHFYGVMLLIASVGTAIVPRGSAPRLDIGIYAAYALALYFSLQGYPVLSLSYQHVFNNYEKYLALIGSQSNRTAEQHIETTAIAAQFKLPGPLLEAVGDASVNVIPWSLMMAQGYRMSVNPSPVIQAYSAYTPYLDQINARQVWANRSAAKIIYSYQTIDRRYPVFDEPATFRALLRCYRTAYAGRRFAVLSRIACTPPTLLALGPPQNRSLGRWIRIPARARYAQIRVHTTLFGHLMTILFKPGEVRISFRLADGSLKGPYRFIYPIARDGLFIKYFVASQADSEQLFTGHATSLPRITAIRIASSPDSPDYARHLQIRFLRDSAARDRLAVAARPAPRHAIR